MRPLTPGDLDAAVRALLAMPEGARSAAARRLVRQASWADSHVLMTGRAHDLWGNGTLEAAARSCRLAPPRPLGDRNYLGCLALLLEALLWHDGAVADNCSR